MHAKYITVSFTLIKDIPQHNASVVATALKNVLALMMKVTVI